MNNFINRSLLNAPIEIIKAYNPINPSSKPKIQYNGKVKKRESKKEYINNYKYEMNEEAWLKNFNSQKLESPWTGPHQIIKVERNKQRILLKVGKKLQWHNLKNIKPVWKESKIL